jgi:hypothetical protein
MEPFDLFKTEAFRVRRLSDGKEFLAVKIKDKYIGRLPDRPHFEDVERTLVHKDVRFDPVTGARIETERLERVKDKAKCFTFTGDAASDSHGGMISVVAGDYLLKDGDSYFAVPDIDKRSRRPIFEERFVRI